MTPAEELRAAAAKQREAGFAQLAVWLEEAASQDDRNVNRAPRHRFDVTAAVATARAINAGRSCATDPIECVHEAALGQAEEKLAQIRKFIDEDFRFWCSPNGVAGRYARDILAVIDRPGSTT